VIRQYPTVRPHPLFLFTRRSVAKYINTALLVRRAAGLLLLYLVKASIGSIGLQDALGIRGLYVCKDLALVALD